MAPAPFHAARLGPSMADLAMARHGLSVTVLQGGGLRPGQIRRVPLPGFGIAALLRRFADGLAKRKRQ